MLLSGYLSWIASLDFGSSSLWSLLALCNFIQYHDLVAFNGCLGDCFDGCYACVYGEFNQVVVVLGCCPDNDEV